MAETETIPEVEKETGLSDKDLAEMLAGYNQPAIEEPSSEADTSAPSTPPVTDTATALGGQTGDWRGNPAYYQTGQKIGQLRPTSKIRVETQAVKDTEVTGDILDGEMLVMLIDTVIPMLIGIAHNSFSTYKIDVDKMELTPKQEKNLVRLCDKCAQKLILKGDPLWILVLVCLAIYGGQYYALRQEAKMEAEFAKKKAYEERTKETA